VLFLAHTPVISAVYKNNNVLPIHRHFGANISIPFLLFNFFFSTQLNPDGVAVAVFFR
jgi:hypothetical protein